MDAAPPPSEEEHQEIFAEDGAPVSSSGIVEVFPLLRSDVSFRDVTEYLNLKPEQDRPAEGLIVFYDGEGVFSYANFGNTSRKDILWMLELMKLKVMGVE